MTVLREALADRIGRPERVEPEAAPDELRDRQQRLAPLVRAGDADAIAEFDQVEAAIDADTRRQRIDELADAHQQALDRQAAADEAERQRVEWAERKAELERQRESALARCEAAIVALVESIETADSLGREVEQVGKLLDPSFHERRTRYVIEDRLGVMLGSLGIRDIHVPLGRGVGHAPLGRHGMEQFAEVERDDVDVLTNADLGPDTPDTSTRAGACTICAHERAGEIAAALQAKEPYRSIEQRFGVSRSALSRHAKH